MTHQPSFSQAEFATKKKTTRREKFLTRMEALIPWTKLLAVIEPFYPKGERGRPPVGLERMLRVYFLQQWYGLADEALEDALYDSQALQGFARIDLSADGVPDATTLLKFRRLLETHDLCKGLFSAINADLTAHGLLLREGTLVDATLIAAPPSTKNKERQRDPEMHQTRKGNQWYFGMKAHITADLFWRANAHESRVFFSGLTFGPIERRVGWDETDSIRHYDTGCPRPADRARAHRAD